MSRRYTVGPLQVSRGQHGQWCIYALDNDGYLMQRQYYDYTRREAEHLFRVERRAMAGGAAVRP